MQQLPNLIQLRFLNSIITIISAISYKYFGIPFLKLKKQINMRKIYFTILTLLSISSYSQYITSSPTIDNYTKDLKHNGTLAIGDRVEDINFSPFQINYSQLNKQIAIPIRNGSGGLVIAVGGSNGWHSHLAKTGDAVIRIMGGKNLIFGSGSQTRADFLPGQQGVQKFVFQDNSMSYDKFEMSNVPTMNVYNTGKVTIGTDMYDKSGYRLFVKDGIKTERLKVEIASENQWADYVFNDDYSLMSLNDVKTFIDINKHLPNIPSVKQILDDGGIEQGELNAKLLEKIEELTLHLIEQNQKIEKLEKQVESLKK